MVLLSGKDFTGATAVSFGAVSAPNFAVMSDTKIVVEVPDAAAAAKELITVTTPDGTNTAGASYDYGAPVIKSLSPGFADPDSSGVITITGSGFLGAVAADVKFGAVAALKIWVLSDTQMVATTPINVTGPPAVVVPDGVTDVTVTRNSVVSATDDKSKFLFTAGIPTVTTLGTVATPVTGTDGVAAGADLTITGTRLWGVSKISFDSTSVTNSADITIASDGNSLTVKVPNRSAGPTEVTVINAAGTSLTNLKTRFSYYGTTAPKVSSVYPNVFDQTASVSSTFLVSGSGFTGLGTTNVTLKCGSDVTPTVVSAVSDKSLIVTAPGSGSAEACDLEIVNPVDSGLTTTATAAVRFV